MIKEEIIYEEPDTYGVVEDIEYYIAYMTDGNERNAEVQGGIILPDQAEQLQESCSQVVEPICFKSYRTSTSSFV